MNLKDRNELIQHLFVSKVLPKCNAIQDFVLELFNKGCMAELNKKGSDYSHGVDNDANQIFGRVADKIGITKYNVWAVYFWKHYDAIIGWAKGNVLKAEGGRSRTIDAVNYLLILLTMLKERAYPELLDDYVYDTIYGLITALYMKEKNEDLVILSGFIQSTDYSVSKIFECLYDIKR